MDLTLLRSVKDIFVSVKFTIRPFMILRDFSDQDLLVECRMDNQKAFNILFERYSVKLYNYALRYLNDDFLAKEVMMDLMIWVWQKRHTLQLRGEFSPYIFCAVKYATIRAIRKKAVFTLSIESIDNDSAFIARSADHDLNSKEILQEYHKKVNQLSPQRKRVFTMSRESEMSNAEIASSLRLSINTVKNHIKSSLSHFRETNHSSNKVSD